MSLCLNENFKVTPEYPIQYRGCCFQMMFIHTVFKTHTRLNVKWMNTSVMNNLRCNHIIIRIISN